MGKGELGVNICSMTTRKESFAVGEFYHIYNRGNSKQKIFLDDKDRDRFIKLLYLCNSTKNVRFREDIVDMKIDAWDFDRGELLVSLGAWALMPNHFHLLITLPPRVTLGAPDEDQEGPRNPISLFMNKVSTAYSMYFNKKYKRTGSLFEGRFKSVRMTRDEQAKYIFSYIHLNPVKLIDSRWREGGLKNTKKTIEFLKKYQWSSYQDYISKKRSEGRILSLKNFPTYFSGKKVFDREIFEWLNFKEV